MSFGDYIDYDEIAELTEPRLPRSGRGRLVLVLGLTMTATMTDKVMTHPSVVKMPSRCRLDSLQAAAHTAHGAPSFERAVFRSRCSELREGSAAHLPHKATVSAPAANNEGSTQCVCVGLATGQPCVFSAYSLPCLFSPAPKVPEKPKSMTLLAPDPILDGAPGKEGVLRSSAVITRVEAGANQQPKTLSLVAPDPLDGLKLDSTSRSGLPSPVHSPDSSLRGGLPVATGVTMPEPRWLSEEELCCTFSPESLAESVLMDVCPRRPNPRCADALKSLARV